MSPVIDSAIVAKLLAEGGNWIAHVMEKRRSKGAQMCAHILHEAGVVTVLIRSLDTEIRQLIASLIKLDKTTSQKKREAIFDAINDFVQSKTTVTRLAEANSALVELHKRFGLLSPKTRTALDHPLWHFNNLSLAVVDVVNAEPFEPDFFGDWEIADLWIRLKDAKTNEQMAGAAAFAREKLQKMDFLFATHASTRFGKLKAVVLSRFPSLPAPNWVPG